MKRIWNKSEKNLNQIWKNPRNTWIYIYIYMLNILEQFPSIFWFWRKTLLLRKQLQNWQTRFSLEILGSSPSSLDWNQQILGNTNEFPKKHVFILKKNWSEKKNNKHLTLETHIIFAHILARKRWKKRWTIGNIVLSLEILGSSAALKSTILCKYQGNSEKKMLLILSQKICRRFKNTVWVWRKNVTFATFWQGQFPVNTNSRTNSKQLIFCEKHLWEKKQFSTF